VAAAGPGPTRLLQVPPAQRRGSRPGKATRGLTMGDRASPGERRSVGQQPRASPSPRPAAKRRPQPRRARGVLPAAPPPRQAAGSPQATAPAPPARARPRSPAPLARPGSCARPPAASLLQPALPAACPHSPHGPHLAADLEPPQAEAALAEGGRWGGVSAVTWRTAQAQSEACGCRGGGARARGLGLRRAGCAGGGPAAPEALLRDALREGLPRASCAPHLALLQAPGGPERMNECIKG
jgi:hypothetical protein